MSKHSSSRSASPVRPRSPSRSPERRRSFSRSPQRGGSYSKSPSRSPKRYRPQEEAEPCRILGIFGLSAGTTENDLKDTFSPFGPLETVRLIIDKRTGESKRFGFIYFENIDDAMKAKTDLNGISLHGRQVRIDFSTTKKPHDPTPGRYMGRASNISHGGRFPPSGGRRYEPYRFDRYDDRSRYDDRRYDDRRYDDRYDDRRHDDRYDDRRHDDRRYDDRRYERRYDDRRYDDRRY